jgi:hypothetical protein
MNFLLKYTFKLKINIIKIEEEFFERILLSALKKIMVSDNIKEQTNQFDPYLFVNIYG